MITAIVYLGISSNLSFALGWKYLDPYWLTEPCSSNRAKENEWTFGNILAIGMLVALVLPAFDIQDNGSPTNVCAEEIAPRRAFEQQRSDVSASLSPSASVDASPSPSAEDSPRVEQTWQSGTLNPQGRRRFGTSQIRRQATLEAEAGQANT
ncbi:hypothetical protein KC343_g4424 [Hortaea werneckii]|nr:hypothetical protein KC323_g7705 [Hortaea werneckii]KAI6859104.1 hypothetical protein KC338_g7438 [Hortaea werneckii]KAI7236146.1 hypothetical protein KC352_g14995 [Hortaea werneckii]KAI7563404.1 hypothetical protein KC317_g7756 [Hortaea werneckii]KAI7614029.1 hypothetical protein KC346_g7109 [Hortaea werneckii]